MSDGYIKFNDLLTAVGNMLKEMGSKEVTIENTDYDLSEFCDKLYNTAFERGRKSVDSFDCEGCKHSTLPLDNFPCIDCSRYYVDRYDNKKGDSE